MRAWSVTARRLSAVPGQILTLITIATCFVYPTVWVLGEEGLQAFDINVETGVIVMADCPAADAAPPYPPGLERNRRESSAERRHRAACEL